MYVRTISDKPLPSPLHTAGNVLTPAGLGSWRGRELGQQERKQAKWGRSADLGSCLVSRTQSQALVGVGKPLRPREWGPGEAAQPLLQQTCVGGSKQVTSRKMRL